MFQVGAGIRVPPNSSRLSLRWGVDFSTIKKEVSRGNRFLDWKDGRELLDVPFGDVEKEYGAPYYFLHRADLLNLLLKTAKEKKGITVKTGAKVVEYDFDAPNVKTADGKCYGGDLVVAADGIKSIAREAINGAPAKAVDTGDVAYRILIPSSGLYGDPELEHLMTEPRSNTWTGPEGHFVGYPLRGGELYNMIVCCSVKSTSHGKSLGEDDWLVTADNAELVKRFEGWCSPVQKLCALAGEVSVCSQGVGELLTAPSS
jgi:salicylate hydroxylase